MTFTVLSEYLKSRVYMMWRGKNQIEAYFCVWTFYERLKFEQYMVVILWYDHDITNVILTLRLESTISFELKYYEITPLHDKIREKSTHDLFFPSNHSECLEVNQYMLFIWYDLESTAKISASRIRLTSTFELKCHEIPS